MTAIRETCKELDIEVIDMAVNVDHVHLFIKYSPKYSVSWIAKRLKGRSSKLIRDRIPHLKEWCPGYLWAPSCSTYDTNTLYTKYKWHNLTFGDRI